MTELLNKIAVKCRDCQGDEYKLDHPDDDIEFVSLSLAENFYLERDVDWPQTFLFYNSDDKFIGSVRVEMSCEPHFSSVIMEGGTITKSY